MTTRSLYALALRCTRVYIEQEQPLWSALTIDERRTEIPMAIIEKANVSRAQYHIVMNDNGTPQTILPDGMIKGSFLEFLEKQMWGGK